jgi:Carboxypeptidase regulatory-like domain
MDTRLQERWRGVLIVGLLLMVLPSAVWAQASGIAGLVRDSSGAVLPGVTVEASSPALIERARTVTTDSQGRYNIVDLRPGPYVVTFSLTGFSTVRREGVELTASFTATVNAELRVGALEETVTVTGESPVVDTTNVVRRQVVDSEVIQAMPTSKNWSTIGVMTIGVLSNQNDVGGSAGEHQNQLKAHGGSFNDRLVQMDGLMIANMACNYSCTGVSTNDASTDELSYEIGAISAETGGGGVRVNIIPKEGGNTFSGSVFANFSNSSLQSDNLDEELINLGVKSVDSLDDIYDSSFAFGGPIKRDRLWFWTAHRYWGYEIFRTGVFYEKNPFDLIYDADEGRPGTDSQRNTSNDLRLTWQLTPKNKLSAYYSIAPRETDHWIVSNTRQPEASNLQVVKLNHFETLTFKSTLTGKMLLDFGFGNMSETWTREPVRDVETSLMLPVTEQTTGVNFRAYNATFSENFTAVRSYKGSVSYVPGSHSVKFGFNLVEGPARTRVWTAHDTALTVRNNQPFQVTVRTTPYTTRERLVADLGIYVQDTWTLKRFTLNAGLRYDYLNNKVEEQDAPGGRWIGPRHFDAIENVPNWKDLSPRLGLSYDLTGDGKTALKLTVSRYVATTTVAFARAINPLNTSVNTATRTWNDSNADQIPQESELGPLGSTFGQVIISTTYDPDVVTGWFNRRNNWEYSASVTRELMPRVSAELAYFRRTQGHYTTTDNRDVSPSDYQEYCVTAPTDPRLPGGGGNQICGLYDLDPLKFAPRFADDNMVTFVDNFGKQTQTFDGFDFILTARPRSNLFINGGFSTGIENTDECDSFVDNPSASTSGGTTLTPRAWCARDSGWQSNYKLSGSYTLPWHDIQLGAVFQNLQGQQILANWSVTSTTPGLTLGRAFAGGGSRTIPLIRPGDMYADRRSQLDLRFGKAFRLGGARRLQVMMDVYNTFNSNAAVGATSQAGETPPSLNTTYSSTDPTRPGGAWLTPLNILQGRYVKFGAQLLF